MKYGMLRTGPGMPMRLCMVDKSFGLRLSKENCIFHGAKQNAEITTNIKLLNGPLLISSGMSSNAINLLHQMQSSKRQLT